MQKEIYIQDIKKIISKKYKKEERLIQKLKKAEEQIKNGDIEDADLVFKEMREKYEYK